MKHTITFLAIALICGFSVMAQQTPQQKQQNKQVQIFAKANNPKGINTKGIPSFNYYPDTVTAYTTEGNISTYREITLFKPNQTLPYVILNQKFENNTWVNNKVDSMTFDANRNHLSSAQYIMENGTWVKDDRELYTYDSKGNIILSIEQNAEENEWVNNYKNSSEYDANSNLLTQVSQEWAGSEWENNWMSTYTYDANNREISRIGHSWEGAWINSSKDSTAYNSNGDIILKTYSYWIQEEWSVPSQTIYTYDNNRNLITEIQTGESYGNKDSNVYNAQNKLIEAIESHIFENNWIPNNRYTYQYDAKSNVIERISFVWNLENSQWENTQKQTYVYDQNNNGILGENFEWDGTEWVSADGYIDLPWGDGYDSYSESVYSGGVYKMTASYKKLSTTGISCPTDVLAKEIAVYPNPVKDFVNVSAQNVQIQKVSIYNFAGQKVGEFSSNFANIHTANLPTGVYALQIVTDKGITTKKMIKQ